MLPFRIIQTPVLLTSSRSQSAPADRHPAAPAAPQNASARECPVSCVSPPWVYILPHASKVWYHFKIQNSFFVSPLQKINQMFGMLHTKTTLRLFHVIGVGDCIGFIVEKWAILCYFITWRFVLME